MRIIRAKLSLIFFLVIARYTKQVFQFAAADAYTLGFAALLLSAGVVADRWGSKRVFVAGFVGFAAASLACGLAPGPGFLNATRAIQGIAAALLVPSSLAILIDACAHDARLRARAIGIWTAAGGVAIAAGPVVGGFLLTGLGWRSIFLVNIPICAFGLVLTLRCVPPTQRHERKHPSFDLAGQALSIVAMTALIGAVIEARPFGLTNPMVAGGGLVALGAGAAFIAIEARTASPMLALSVRPNSKQFSMMLSAYERNRESATEAPNAYRFFRHVAKLLGLSHLWNL